MSSDNYPLSQASYLSNRGNVLLKLGRWEAAEKDISAAIDLSPDNAKVAFCICAFVFDQTMPRLLFVFVYLSLIRHCEGYCVSFCVFVSVQTMQRWLCLYFCICIFVNRTCVNLCLVQNIYHFVLRQKFLISLIIIFYGYKNMICIITIFFFNNK